ncbi:MAG: trypsin-like peptidase domain-containing protein [Acidobacteria bacterium]|nr:trypsin-like peptidase domain-containing protein [Acidobacteriota bacterium]MBV9477280.1 trypsin-like peptidase domain-containing protein [Acidobacteriota bacterium]
MSRPRILLAGVLLLLLACKRDVSKLDDVQKMAYAVKPAVVRISAYATAQFRYPASAIARIEQQLRADKHELRARDVSGAELVADTGAGGSGSGFLVHPDGVILTSGHVVAPTRDEDALARELRRNGAIAALVRHFPVDTLRTIYRDEELDRYLVPLAAAGRIEQTKVVNQVELSNGETLPFRIRRFSPALYARGDDLAVLQIDRKALPSLPLGDSEATRVGESIWSVGYPAVASSSDDVIGGWLSRDSDLEATFNPGTITAIKRNVANVPVFQSNVAIYRGNSGGPAVNRDGEVIGVSTWGHTNAEQIKFLVPVNVAKQFLAAAGVTPSTEGAFNEHYRAALEAAGNGRWVDAKRELERAAPLFRNSPELIRFGRDANRAIAAMPAWRRHPYAALAIVLAFVAGLITALVAARRARTPRFPPDVLKAATIETVVAPTGVLSSHAALGRFTILNGTRAGEKLGLGGSGIRIGRESTICEIVLENPKVSRLHAEVVSIDGKVLLIDRNSSNGTYVNDQKIDKRFLKDGDIIYFGGRNAVAVAFHA